MNQIPVILRPEKTVDLVFNPGTIRRTSVLDIAGNRIVLSNKILSLKALNLPQAALLTYLTEEAPSERYGFDIMMTSFSSDHVFLEKNIPAIVAFRISSARKMDLRSFPRIKIDGLSVFFGSEELNIIDISAGGAHLILRKKCFENVKAGETILLRLEKKEDTMIREAKILRHWRVGGLLGQGRIAVKFLQTVDF